MKGDQASIVGGAVEFVKELEHVLSTLEAKKLQILHQEIEEKQENYKNEDSVRRKLFSDSNSSQYSAKSKASSADIEVTLIETHANLRILSIRTHRQLLKLIAGLQALRLTILHLNVTDFHPLVLYSISLKVYIYVIWWNGQWNLMMICMKLWKCRWKKGANWDQWMT